MADLDQVYATTRKQMAELVSGLSDDELSRAVPATPGWSIRDVVVHVASVAECIAAPDFPIEFFAAIGSERAVAVLNEWTERHLDARRPRPLPDVLDGWERANAEIEPMLRGDEPWPDDVLPFAAHILTTDLGVHQHDVYGALGLARERDSAPVRIGLSTFAAGVGLRIGASGGQSLRFVTEDKEKVVGGGDPAATVRAPRFELFRALSGRRSPDQIRAYDWDGDPEPFLDFFYPYGLRTEALVE